MTNYNKLLLFLILIFSAITISCSQKSGKKIVKLVDSEITKLEGLSKADKDSLYEIVKVMDSLHNQIIIEYANFIDNYLSTDSIYGVDSTKTSLMAQEFIAKRNLIITNFVQQRIKMRKFIKEEDWEQFSFKKNKKLENK